MYENVFGRKFFKHRTLKQYGRGVIIISFRGKVSMNFCNLSHRVEVISQI